MTTSPIPVERPFIAPIAGVSHRQGIVRTVEEDHRVVLQRDRENEFDENAIAVYTLEGDHLGFLPRNIAEHLKGAKDERWGGVITEVLPGKTWGLRVKITHTNIPHYPVKAKALSFIAEAAELPEPAADSVEGAVTVFAKSGRLLGTADPDDTQGRAITVTDPDGVKKLFPRAVVTVRTV